jgi:hypothetical protein
MRTVRTSEGAHVSLASLGSNYALRTGAGTVPAAEGGVPPPDPAAVGAAPAPTPGVAQSGVDALVRWIPAETITLYAAIISLSNTSLSKNQALVVLLICLVVNVAAVWSLAVHRAVQRLSPGRNWFSQFPTHVPVWEIMLSSIALFAWISAIPGSWPQQLSFWDPWVGGVAIIVTVVVIAFLAAQLNLSPPVDQTPQSR